MNNRTNKKRANGLLVFSICLLIVAIATPLAFALFADTRGSTTTISFGKIEIDDGKTEIVTTVNNLLPGDEVFEAGILVAKDVFSENMLIRVKFDFSSENAVVSDYVSALNGGTFVSIDGYGNPSLTTAATTANAVASGEGAIANLYTKSGKTYTDSEALITTYNTKTYATTTVIKTSGIYYTVYGAGNAEVNTKIDMFADDWSAFETAYALTGTQAGAVCNYYTSNATNAQPLDREIVVDTAEDTFAVKESVNTQLYYTLYDATAEVTGTYYALYEEENGFVVDTQAVDASGNVFTSSYNVLTGEYTLTAVASGETQATVASGYASNYRWYFDTNSSYFYLAQFFDTKTTTLADGATTMTDTEVDAVAVLRVVEKDASLNANTYSTKTITGARDGDPTSYDITTKSGRDALATYFETQYEFEISGGVEVVPSEDSLTFLGATDSFQANATDAKTALDTQLTAYEGEGETSLSTTETAYNSYYAAQKGFIDAAYAGIETPSADEIAVLTAVSAFNTKLLNWAESGCYAGVASASEFNLNNEITAIVNLNDVISSGDFKIAVGNFLVGLSSSATTNLVAASNHTNSQTHDYNIALANYKLARDIIAAKMAANNLQELFVFCLESSAGVNVVPTGLPQAENQAQYGVAISLSVDIRAIQSANLGIDYATAKIATIISGATTSDYNGFFSVVTP